MSKMITNNTETKELIIHYIAKCNEQLNNFVTDYLSNLTNTIDLSNFRIRLILAFASTQIMTLKEDEDSKLIEITEDIVTTLMDEVRTRLQNDRAFNKCQLNSPDTTSNNSPIELDNDEKNKCLHNIIPSDFIKISCSNKISIELIEHVKYCVTHLTTLLYKCMIELPSSVCECTHIFFVVTLNWFIVDQTMEIHSPNPLQLSVFIADQLLERIKKEIKDNQNQVLPSGEILLLY